MKLSVALKNKEKLGCKIERFVKIIQQAALDNVPRTIGNNYLKKKLEKCYLRTIYQSRALPDKNPLKREF